VTITMAFEALLTLQPLLWFTGNPFTFVKGFDGRGSVKSVMGGITFWGSFQGE